MKKINWMDHLTPLFKLYAKRKHPLEYKNRYQLIVMVILSAQDSDKHINQIAPAFFEKFPSMKELAAASIEEVMPVIKSVRNFRNKSKWLTKTAQAIGTDENIPTSLQELTQFSGIGRKSANVIIRESGEKAEGIIVDLHVVRVAPRIGIAASTKPDKIEKELMELIPPKYWNQAGMAISFLGREICRPTKPKCGECLMNAVCRFYNNN